MTWVFLFSFENPKFSWSGEDLGNNDKEERNKWFVLILFSIGIISLICEFWNPILQTVRNALQKVISLWPYWLSVLTFFAIILGVRNLRKRYLIKIANRRMLEERRRETAAREEYNRQQLENAQEEYTSLNNYFAGKIGETPQAIYWEKICKLWSLSRKYAVLRFGIEERWITAPILPLFEYSEIKNQIVYEGGLIKTILDVLEGVMYECFDDGILATLKINLQALRKFEGTIGYDNLVKLINEKTLVKKFYAEEKEVA